VSSRCSISWTGTVVNKNKSKFGGHYYPIVDYGVFHKNYSAWLIQTGLKWLKALSLGFSVTQNRPFLKPKRPYKGF